MSLPKQHAWMVDLLRDIAHFANSNEQFEIAEDLTSIAQAYDPSPNRSAWGDQEASELAAKRYRLAALRLGVSANRGGPSADPAPGVIGPVPERSGVNGQDAPWET